MKKLTLILLFGTFVAATSCKTKQSGTSPKTTITETETTTTTTTIVKKQKGEGSLDDALARQEEMYTKIGISEKQKESFRAIETKYAKKMRDIRDANASDKDEMYDKLADLQDDKEDEIEKLLTKTQFDEYQTELEKMRAERKEKRK